MCEIGEELWRTKQLAIDSRVYNPQKGHVRSTWWKLKSLVPEGISRLISQLGQLVTWLARCTTSLFCVLSSFIYPYYISSHYPQNCKENFREKTLEIHLRVGDFTPTIPCTFLLVILFSYLSNSILFEMFLAQTRTLPIMSCFGACGKYWMRPFFGGCNWS